MKLAFMEELLERMAQARGHKGVGLHYDYGMARIYPSEFEVEAMLKNFIDSLRRELEPEYGPYVSPQTVVEQGATSLRRNSRRR